MSQLVSHLIVCSLPIDTVFTTLPVSANKNFERTRIVTHP